MRYKPSELPSTRLKYKVPSEIHVRGQREFSGDSGRGECQEEGAVRVGVGRAEEGGGAEGEDAGGEGEGSD